MRKKTLIALSIIFLLSVLLPSYAVGQNASNAAPAATDAATTPLKRAAERKEALQERKEAAQQRLTEKRSALQTKKEELQTTRAARKEEFKAKREEFKEKIQTIKDEKKKAVVDRLDAKMNNVNTNRTARFTSAISKLRAILGKIQDKATAAKTSGKDTSTLDTALLDAQTALDAAEEAIAVQAEKEYVITVEDESTLRSTVGSTTKQLQEDLRATHKLVVGAKQAVQNARKELASLNDNRTEASTGSATEE